MPKQARHRERSAATRLPWMAALNGPVLETLARAGAACNQASLAWQQEVVRFTTARLESDSQLGQQLLTCRNWTDVAKLQRDWLSSMTHDYLDEANRLVRLASKFGTEVVLPPIAEAQRPAE